MFVTSVSTSVSIDDVDFEKVYWETIEAGRKMPWDTGAPQPALVALEAAGAVGQDVLDVGCGLGDNVIYLVRKGYRAVGVDVAPTAIALAGMRAQKRGVSAEFAVADATVLAGYDGRFDTVLDFALYHGLTPEARFTYVDALTRVTRPGAKLHLFCHYTTSPALPEAFRITEESLRATVGRTWDITYLAPAVYSAGMSPDELHHAVQAMLPEEDLESIARPAADRDGNAEVRVWQLTAVRP